MEDRKKAGILTWTRFWNYGSLLQAAALYKAVSDLGAETYIIDYAPSAKTKLRNQIKYRNSSALYFSKIKSVVYDRFFTDRTEIQLKHDRMRSFIERSVTFTETAFNAKDLERVTKGIDTLICGSDQIWTPVSFNPEYFLDFAPSTKGKIAYAPSFGVQAVPESKKKIISDLINRFDFVSVREMKGAEIVWELTGKEAEVNADPVLLAEDSWWKEKAVLPRMGDPFVFVYILGNNEAYFLAERHGQGCKIKCINESRKKIGCKDSELVNTASPEEFLGLILKAEKIYTDSYHGLLFSLIFRKPVKVVRRFDDNSTMSQNSRIDNVFEIIGRPYHECGGEITESDYEEIDKAIMKLRKKSMLWLRNALYADVICETRETVNV